MTILQALTSFYSRLASENEAPQFGFSDELIGFELVLAEDGKPLALDPLGDPDARRPGQRLYVPAAVKRTRNPASNFLWDKTAYVFGVTGEKDDNGVIRPVVGKGTADEHAEFKQFHEEVLAGTNDAGLFAVSRFLKAWVPTQFEALNFPVEALDRKVVFRLDSDTDCRVHERPAAQQLWTSRLSAASGKDTQCLVSGERGHIARLHPLIKGVAGAQSSGASLVSFNEAAYETRILDKGSVH